MLRFNPVTVRNCIVPRCRGGRDRRPPRSLPFTPLPQYLPSSSPRPAGKIGRSKLRVRVREAPLRNVSKVTVTAISEATTRRLDEI